MPPAIILNTYYAALSGTSGALAANSGDSLSIPLTGDNQNYIHAGWGINSDSVGTVAVTDTRTDSVHDPQYGVRYGIPALLPGGAAAVASHYWLRPPANIQVFPGDTLTFTATGTSGDDVIASTLTRYNDLPGMTGQFARWEQVQSMRETDIGVYCAPVANTTPGVYGTARAVNADDNRWTGGKYYAILGWTVQTACTTLAFAGQAWGNNKIGGPAGVLNLDTTNYFVNLYKETGIPCIPVFNGYDSGNVYMYAADGEASTSPKVYIFAYQLSGNPVGV